MRVVSLLPSSTEIISVLGMGAHLVGRSHECDYPPGVEALPVVTAPKFDPHGVSADIDARVKTILQEATSVYRLDADLLQKLAPNLIVTQTQCDVCAVSFDEVERVACEWLALPAKIISLEPNRLDDVMDDILRVARALDIEARGEVLVSAKRARMEAVAASVRHLPAPTVALIEWIDPLMAAGNWMPELVALANGRNLFGAAGEHSPWLQWDALAAADPDIIILLPCGYSIARTLSELDPLLVRPGWADLRAVRSGQVFVADGNQYFNRPGPRLADSVEILAEILHPGAVDYGHEGRGWQRLSPAQMGLS